LKLTARFHTASSLRMHAALSSLVLLSFNGVGLGHNDNFCKKISVFRGISLFSLWHFRDVYCLHIRAVSFLVSSFLFWDIKLVPETNRF
jgi:hypothetical protein